ncbi:MAG: hypothetical protein ACEQSL_01905 [Sediminibacterium sp.]
MLHQALSSYRSRLPCSCKTGKKNFVVTYVCRINR